VETKAVLAIRLFDENGSACYFRFLSLASCGTGGFDTHTRHPDGARVGTENNINFVLFDCLLC